MTILSIEAIDALEEWHKTTRALRDAKPGTSDWVRLRMIAEEQRVAYDALIGAGEGAAAERSTLPVEPERQPR